MAIDNGGAKTTSSIVAITVTGSNRGSISWQRWDGIGGTAISSLTGNVNYPNSPSASGTFTSFEAPFDVLDNIGYRVRGYISPSVTGAYTFYIASDDNSELLLSTSRSESNKVRIATVTDWTGSREWIKQPNQKSTVITLTAGQSYYIEALMKEGDGGDNLAVGWTGPGISTITVIAGQYLSPYSSAAVAPSITTQPPAYHSLSAGQPFNLSVVATGTSLTYQWRKDGRSIAGATGSTYVKASVTALDAGTYTVVVSNAVGSVTSNPALLSVGSLTLITQQPRTVQFVLSASNVRCL